MDYEKKYREALERAKNLYENANGRILKRWIEQVFPELKESEDESVRKSIYNYINATLNDNENVEKEKWLAWLEKQKELVSTGFEDVWAATDCEKLTAPLEKYSKDAIMKLCHAWYDKGIELERKKQLEKQGEQKPTDKVEPKFHEGEWVVYNCDICQIVKREEGCNNLVTTFGIEKELVNERNLSTARLWTIKDAKDGDVLVASDKSIFLFAGVVDCACKYYAALTTDNTVQINKEVECGYWETSRSAYPATKEQRELFFQKMKEAGYEWDVNEKKLKKIEQEYHCTGVREPKEATGVLKQLINKENYAWSEEDKNLMYKTLSNLTELKDRYGEGYGNVGKCIDWLKSLKDRYTWKPSEEQMKALDDALSLAKNCGEESSFYLRRLYEQLKKLKA